MRALAVVILLIGLGCSRTDHIIPVAEEDFERDVLQSPTPTVVEFWAHGCIPCVKLARPLEKVAAEYEGRVAFRKLNAGWTARTRKLYNFDAVPTLIFYRNGREVARQVGVPEDGAYDGLVQFVEEGLAARATP
ncbi:MAG TPA: thioredoxin domain-containing protein [Candidatus Krumholzibacteria bacterium]|nr:thioredoxin domain-containing protein [Candidatus Krumholzibacteria bacterium]